jgi:hypothetical protein
MRAQVCLWRVTASARGEKGEHRKAGRKKTDKKDRSAVSWQLSAVSRAKQKTAIHNPSGGNYGTVLIRSLFWLKADN